MLWGTDEISSLSQIKNESNDRVDLLERYLLEFAAYHAALETMCLAFMRMDKKFVCSERDTGRGWLEWHSSPNDKDETSLNARTKVLIAKWGLPDQFSEAQFKEAETRAEISTEDDCIIEIKALGSKRWRTQVFDGLFESKVGPRHGLVSVALDDLLANINAKVVANRSELLKRFQKSLEEVGVKSEHPFMEQLTGVGES